MGETVSPFTKQTHDAKAFSSMTPQTALIPTSKRAGTFTALTQPKRTNLLRDAHEAERLMMDAIRNCPQTVEALTGFAGLVRSFVALVDCIQRLRGIPTPGQLRPDLDPVQIARMLKRAKARQPIDLEQLTNGKGKFYDEPEPEKEPTKIESKKESLSPTPTVTAEREGGGAKTG